MSRRSAVLVSVVALAALAGTAHAAPAPSPPLRIADPVGDSTSADAGHDLSSLTFRSARARQGHRVLTVILETRGPLPAADAAHEVTFSSGDCTFHLGHWSHQRTGVTPPISSEPFTFDCGATSDLYAGLGDTGAEARLVGVDVIATSRSVTWVLTLDDGTLLPPGAVLGDLTSWSSHADQTQQLWAPVVRGALTYDTATSPRAFRLA